MWRLENQMKTKQSIQYKQNLKLLMKLTLINILNAKGVIYTYYKQQREKMSECNKCGITDHEITPKQIKKYLGEEPNNNILDQQTDNMFFTYENETVCRICDLK